MAPRRLSPTQPTYRADRRDRAGCPRPVELTVKGGAVNRVYAIGDPGKKTMNVVVHVIPTGSSGSGQPSDVNTGVGGLSWDPAHPLKAAALGLTGVMPAGGRGQCRVAAPPAGCGSAAGSTIDPTPGGVAHGHGGGTQGEPGPVPTARVLGKPGRTERVHFVPELLVLPGRRKRRCGRRPPWAGSRRCRRTSSTSAGGDGSAYAGDPFGPHSIAGHVDSAPAVPASSSGCSGSRRATW